MNKHKPIKKLTAHQIIPENILLHDLSIKNLNLLQVEISPTDACNQNCTWCFTVNQRIVGRSVTPAVMRQYLDDFIKQGGSSVVFSGGGEPLLYKPLYSEHSEFDNKCILSFCIDNNLIVGLITNGVGLLSVLSSVDIHGLAFLRISVDTLDKQRYSNLHNCNSNHHDKLLKNIELASTAKGESLTPALGLSFVVDNASQLNVTDKEFEVIRKFVSDKEVDFVQFKHLHTLDEECAEKTMSMIHSKLVVMDWKKTEFWVQKYIAPKASKVCKVTNIIQSLGGQNKKFPCCHLFGKTEYLDQLNHSPIGLTITNCPSRVCRYVSVNNVLLDIETQMSLSKSQNRLSDSLATYGYHPYRMFPTAPDLYFPVKGSDECTKGTI